MPLPPATQHPRSGNMLAAQSPLTNRYVYNWRNSRNVSWVRGAFQPLLVPDKFKPLPFQWEISRRPQEAKSWIPGRNLPLLSAPGAAAVPAAMPSGEQWTRLPPRIQAGNVSWSSNLLDTTLAPEPEAGLLPPGEQFTRSPAPRPRA